MSQWKSFKQEQGVKNTQQQQQQQQQQQHQQRRHIYKKLTIRAISIMGKIQNTSSQR